MAIITVMCGCRGVMRREKAAPGEALDWHICPGCKGAVQVRVHEEPRPSAASCGVVINRQRCGRVLAPGAMLCGPCGEAIIKGALEDPAWRTWTARHVADISVRKAKLDILATEKEEAEREKQRQKAARRAARADDSGHVVYYARTGENQIKIGTTGDLPRRMREFRLVNPANVLAAEPGGYELERQRHDEFKAERWNKRTEDFTDSPALLLHIELTREEHGDPYALAARLLAEHEGRGLQSALLG